MSVEARLFVAADADGVLALGGPWALAEIKGQATRSQKSINSGAAQLLVAENAKRKAVLIYNNSSDVIYIGEDSDVTTSDGMPILPQVPFMDTITDSAWYATGATSGIDVRIIEVAY